MLETKNNKLLDVEVLKCNAAATAVSKVLPELAEMINTYATAEDNFYRINYPFGATIIDNGKVYLPLVGGGKIALNDHMLPDAIARDLNFDPATEDPLILILDKTSELYLAPSPDRIMSHATISPGSILGIPRATDIAEPGVEVSGSYLNWQLNSGVRFLFMLSKIADKTKYEKLSKTLKARINPPTSFITQWDMFTEIARKCDFSWRSSILIFPRRWITQVKTREWYAVTVYLMHRHRASYNVWHNKLPFWITALNEIEKQKNLSGYSPYVIATVRQIFYIAAKSSIGFRPATTDDSAPVSSIQQIFDDRYGLINDKQSSTIMEPAYINIETGEPIYYSVNYPVLSEHKPHTFKGKSQITFLEDVINVINATKACVADGSINIPADLANIIRTTEFSFYHSNDDQESYQEIKNSSLLTADQRFLFNQKTAFVESNSFFRGCIKIVRKK